MCVVALLALRKWEQGYQESEDSLSSIVRDKSNLQKRPFFRNDKTKQKMVSSLV